MKLQSISRVVIRVPNWVGDAVMAVPALREFRRIFAEAQITLAARPWVSGLFEGEELADHTIPLRDSGSPIQSAINFARDTSTLRKNRFNAAVLLQNAFGAALLARTAGIGIVAGYPTDARRALLTHVIPFEPDYKTSHQVRYYLKIAAELERRLTGEDRVDLANSQPSLHVTEIQREHARSMMRKEGISAEAWNRPRIVALNPGATNSRSKRWLAERFAATADRLAEQNGFQTIIVGAPAEVEVAAQVAAQMRSPAVILAGRTTIAELKGVLACCSLVISNDTGTAHVSAALDVPTVVVFGSTEHVSTRPLSGVAKVVRHDVECSPCMLRDCPIDHRCMTRVEVDDVYLAARNLLAERSSEARP